ncbi:MAG TPA: DUF1657 domain-containing protein [Tissierellaceae bacterium]|nr:DUF1657 domain-containing protein [Tissierellaceae bacterium]
MTVKNKLETALASAKGLAADLKTFSLDTDDQNAKQMFETLSTDADNIAKMIENRVNHLKNITPESTEQSDLKQF